MGATRRIEVELRYIGDGTIVERPRGVFRGGVPEPELSRQFGFNVLPQQEDEEGSLSPPVDGQSLEAALQVNLWGTSADFRELGRYLLAIAELDTTVDPGFHQHHDELRTNDGRTRVDLIVRKIPS